MKPIAQTFTVDDPDVDRIFIRSVELFFAKKSADPNIGVLVQIRKTANGIPMHGEPCVITERHLVSSDINVDATKGLASTKFTFPATPLGSGEVYAIVVVPDGGSDEFLIWTSKLNQTDVSTENPITKNNDTGSLYLSGNDVTWLPIIDEDLKFTVNRCEFTTEQGMINLVSHHDELISIKEENFTGLPNNETIYIGDDDNIAVLTITAPSAGFTVGETVYQDSGSGNTATGVVYSYTATKMKVNTVTGSFAADIVYGATSLSTATVTAYNQDTSITVGSLVVSVPDASIYALYDWVYFISTTALLSQSVYITARDTSLNTITIHESPRFTDATAIIGRCRGGAARGGLGPGLSGMFASMFTLPDYEVMMIKRSTANTTVNFTQPYGARILGWNGIYATGVRLLDLPYESMHTGYNIMIPPGTNVQYGFRGVDRETNVQDMDEIPFENYSTIEFNDKSRAFMSKSNELTVPEAQNWMGMASFQTNLYFDTTNSKISPVLDAKVTPANVIHNIIAKQDNRAGVYLNVTTTSKYPFVSSSFAANSYIYNQTGKRGTIYSANSTVVTVLTTNPFTWSVGDTISSIANQATASRTGVVNKVTYFSEAAGNPPRIQSRYVSRKFDLADGLDAEDLKVFVTGYRPVGAEFKVYCRLQADGDMQTFNSKIWSWMYPTHSDALRSSATDKNDFVELEYELPYTVSLQEGSVTASKNSTTVSMTSTAEIRANQHIYLYDTNTKSFDVRNVLSVANSTAIVLRAAPRADFGFSNTHIGVVEALDHDRGAFKFNENGGIIRYIDSQGRVNDTYKHFAIKIVPVSEANYIVPRAADFRAIALQI